MGVGVGSDGVAGTAGMPVAAAGKKSETMF